MVVRNLQLTSFHLSMIAAIAFGSLVTGAEPLSPAPNTTEQAALEYAGGNTSACLNQNMETIVSNQNAARVRIREYKDAQLAPIADKGVLGSFNDLTQASPPYLTGEWFDGVILDGYIFQEVLPNPWIFVLNALPALLLGALAKKRKHILLAHPG